MEIPKKLGKYVMNGFMAPMKVIPSGQSESGLISTEN